MTVLIVSLFMYHRHFCHFVSLIQTFSNIVEDGKFYCLVKGCSKWFNAPHKSISSHLINSHKLNEELHSKLLRKSTHENLLVKLFTSSSASRLAESSAMSELTRMIADNNLSAHWFDKESTQQLPFLKLSDEIQNLYYHRQVHL